MTSKSPSVSRFKTLHTSQMSWNKKDFTL